MDQNLLGFISRLMQLGVPREQIPQVLSALIAQRGMPDNAIPYRGMARSTNPALPTTAIPNAYRGPLQPVGALPEYSPSAYPGWQTKI